MVKHDILRSLTSAALMLLASTSQAAADAPVPRTLEEANAQRDRASAMRKEADARYTTEQAECYKKFLVNSCLEDAKKRRTEATLEARKIDNPARDFQRDAKRSDVEAKEAKREADKPVREAEQKAQGEQYRTDEAAKAAARKQKMADKAEKAAKNRQKMAEDRAKYQEKLAARAKKDAERAEKRAKRDAKNQASIKEKSAASIQP